MLTGQRHTSKSYERHTCIFHSNCLRGKEGQLEGQTRNFILLICQNINSIDGQVHTTENITELFHHLTEKYEN